MSHPFLRILAAVFLAFVSPLCCCQAMAVVGFGHECADAVTEEVQEQACAGGCCGKVAASQTVADEPAIVDPRDDRSSRPGDPCPECPVCQTAASNTGSGLVPEVKVADADWVAVVFVAAIWGDWMPVVRPVGSIPERGERETVCVMSGRNVLRWQCALMV